MDDFKTSVNNLQLSLNNLKTDFDNRIKQLQSTTYIMGEAHTIIGGAIIDGVMTILIVLRGISSFFILFFERNREAKKSFGHAEHDPILYF